MNSNVEDRPIAILVDREGLGDVLLKLPLLRAIARGCPGRAIWWVATRTTEMAGPLRTFMPAEVAVVREEKAQLEKPLRAVIRRLRELPAFSLIFDTRTRIGSVWLARQVLAHERFFCCLPGYLLSSARPAGRFARPRHIGMRALSLAQAAFGAKVDGSGELGCTQASQEAAGRLLPDGPVYVGLGMGSRETRKNWPVARFAELARGLASCELAPVLLLGPQESARADEIRATVPAAAAINLAGPNPTCEPLDLAIAVAKRLAVVVANDSGMGHLFGAAGRPIVSLFGPTDPRRWAPFAPIRRTVCAQDFGGDAMLSIPPEAVLGAVKEILAEAHATKKPEERMPFQVGDLVRLRYDGGGRHIGSSDPRSGTATSG
jgi:ADP-heptose:LPS heptosyltransferase